jgi:hypothetical protein
MKHSLNQTQTKENVNTGLIQKSPQRGDLGGLQFWCLLGLLCLLAACKNADDFYDKLSSIPQISHAAQYQYLSAYGVGDTLTITGLLYPDNDLHITIGDVEAPVVKINSLEDPVQKKKIDRASVVITEAMGIGNDRPVTVISGGYTVSGASIQIYALGGEGSLDGPVKLSLLTVANKKNVYLNCVNGKGDVYYYGVADGNLYQLKKDGTAETLLTASQLSTDQNGSFTVSAFIAGGVSPDGGKAWVSLYTGSDGYRFCEIDLAGRSVKTLTKSANIAAPYEGNISDLKTIISGVFAGNDGVVYVYIGKESSSTGYHVTADNKALAIARYDSKTGQLQYVFRTIHSSNDMPGVKLSEGSYLGLTMRLNPVDGTLYVFSQHSVSSNGGTVSVTGVTEYRLNTGTQTGSFIPYNLNSVSEIILGPMAYIKMAFVYNSMIGTLDARNFGMLPLPNRKLLFLYGQRWLVMDFAGNNLYQWAPGNCDMGSYTIYPNAAYSTISNVDELVNYDGDSQLYMTVTGRSSIVKMIKQ